MPESRIVVRTERVSVIKVKTPGAPGARGLQGAPEWEAVGESLDLTGLGEAVIGPFPPGYNYQILGEDVTADNSPGQVTFGLNDVFEYPPLIHASERFTYVVGGVVAEMFPDPTIQTPELWGVMGHASVTIGHITLGVEGDGVVTMPPCLLMGRAYLVTIVVGQVDVAVGVYSAGLNIAAVLVGNPWGILSPGIYSGYVLLPGDPETLAPVDITTGGFGADITNVSFVEVTLDKIIDSAEQFASYGPGSTATTINSTSPVNDITEVTTVVVEPGYLGFAPGAFGQAENFGPETSLTVDGSPVGPLAGHHYFSNGTDQGWSMPIELADQPTDFDLIITRLGDESLTPKIRVESRSRHSLNQNCGAYELPANYLLFTVSGYPDAQFLSGILKVKRRLL